MSDPIELRIHGAIVAALKEDAGLTALINGRVFDDVPSRAAFPYVRFGKVDVRPVRATGVVADEIAFTIDVYSRAIGSVEGKRVAGAVRSALDGRTDITLGGGAYLWRLSWMVATTDKSPDGASPVVTVLFEAGVNGAG